MKLKLAFLLYLCPIFWAQAQQALRPGDQLPAVSEGAIHTDAYNDRVLIIDFWATSCASCIESMPRLAALQQHYGKRLQIVLVDYEKPERIARFFAARPDLAAYHLPVIAQDSIYKKFFPHQYLPHLVWINQGKYIKATGEEYVNSNGIDSVINGRDLNAAQKADIIGFDYKQPLFPVTSNPQSGKAPLYTSVLSGYIDGLPLSAGIITDSARHRKRFYAINHSIAHLYALALNSNLPLQANRRILPRDSAYDYSAKEGYRNNWEQQHCFCYEFSGPQGTPDSVIKNKLSSDLDQFLGLHGRLANRETACLLLEGHPAKSTADRLVRQDMAGHYIKLQHITADDLTYILNQQSGMPPVIVQTGPDAAFDLAIAEPPARPADWQELLRKNGLRLTPVNKVLPMFILSTH